MKHSARQTLFSLLLTAAVACSMASPAQAAHHHHRRHHQIQASTGLFGDFGRPTAAPRVAADPRAARWCGWQMRRMVGTDPGPTFNLARNWAHWGSAASGPSIGVVVVWSHHVGKIVGQENGQWIVQSGNDGGAVRARPLSLAHAIAFRW